MKRRMVPTLVAAIVFVAGSLYAELSPDQVKQLPSPATHQIDFTKEIKPILETRCANCHGHGRSKGKFRMDNRETFLKGGSSGPAVIEGNSKDSLLIELVMGFDPDAVMPAKGSKLKTEQIALLRAWIDQGAKWDTNVWLGKVEAQNLHPRSPAIPAAKKVTTPIDAFVDAYFKTNKIKWAEPVDDRLFARRVYLDVLGLLPPPEELNAFLRDKSRDKREKLVARLLSKEEDYAQHWLSFWNDMLRNDYKGTGYIDGGRKQITKWLYSALLTNMPYDQFVAELVNPNPESEGFTKGIVWRGVVNASQTPEMQAAQSISQVFMGLNMKCASCHDSFINDWQLSDAYGLANVFSDQQLELVECDKPTGKMAATKFLYPEFGVIDAKADKATRLKQLAGCMTSEKNGRLSRTLVNRMWQRFMGRGFVEPVDDMEQRAWHPDLLDWLAEDFVAHGYDVKHLITQIVTSRAYQLPAVDVAESEQRYVFRGPAIRRMTAEQFRDALTAVTGIGYAEPAVELDVVEPKKKFDTSATPKWIWNDKEAATRAKAEFVYFRKTFSIPAEAKSGTAIVVCDNSFTLFVNGQKAGAGNDFTRPSVIDIGKFLSRGENLIAIEAINNLPGNNAPTPETATPGTENPAGLLAFVRVECDTAKKPIDIATDASWTWSVKKEENWEKLSPTALNWPMATELGNISMQPWRTRKDLVARKLSDVKPGKVRASLVAADPLMVALGRPNREQVVTTRPSAATTLQALELTNGETVSDVLKRGAAELAEKNVNHREFVQKLYQQALGRKPTSTEFKAAEELVGKPLKKEGVEDFLWVMTMLPEFQLIY